MMTRPLFYLIVALLGFTACSVEPTATTLPVLGNKDVVNGDTVYHTIPDFAFVNQDSQRITNADFAGKAYVSDHFFISCPTICPKLTKSMLRIHERFADHPDLLLLSHSIDTKYDTIPALKRYADGLGVTSDKWHFVTGEKAAIMDIAEDYFNVAMEDQEAPGGYNHSGRLILVDPQRRVRAFADGTDPASVDKFMEEISFLLSEIREDRVATSSVQ